MNRKKIKLHVFSQETGHRSEEFGWFRIFLWIFVISTSVMGAYWVIKDPALFERFVGDKALDGLKDENKALRNTLKGVEKRDQVLDSSIVELKSVVERVSSLAGVVADTTKKIELITSEDFLSEIKMIHKDAQKSLRVLEENTNKIKSLPILFPVQHRRFMSAGYEARLDPFTGSWIPHRGVDFPGAVGDTVFSTAYGQVISAQNSKIEGYAIKIDHDNGLATKYTHLSELLVKSGQRVKRGQAIALLGSTGRSTGSHLHYELIYKDRLLNPKAFILPDTF